MRTLVNLLELFISLCEFVSLLCSLVLRILFSIIVLGPICLGLLWYFTPQPCKDFVRFLFRSHSGP